jgi:hypothetical protein
MAHKHCPRRRPQARERLAGHESGPRCVLEVNGAVDFNPRRADAAF